jgi:activating signal cointegrator complex subunit 3
VLVLLQAYIGGFELRGFTLISDRAYIQQNSGRIARALFEVFLRKGNCVLAERFLTISKAIDKQLWWEYSPLRQFAQLFPSEEVLRKLCDCGVPLDELCDLSATELGALVRHPSAGSYVRTALQSLPFVSVEASVQPVTRSILRLTLRLYPEFRWSDRTSGVVEPWWVWIEDADSNTIYHSEYVMVHKKQVISGEPIVLVASVPVFEPLPPQYWVRVVSDRWLGMQTATPISFRHLLLPQKQPPNTDLLLLSPLPVSALGNALYERMYAGGFSHFNPVQSQAFFTLYRTDENVLLGAPTGSGKTVAAELAVFRLLSAHPGAKVVYVAPIKALVAERVKDWQRKFGAASGLHKTVAELTGDNTPDAGTLRRADILITTPEKFDSISRGWRHRSYVKDVGVVILDEVHLLGEERGPVLEVIVSRLRYMANVTGRPVRFVALSTALANAKDVGDWLGVSPRGMFNFRSVLAPCSAGTRPS